MKARALLDDLRADAAQYQRFGPWYRRLGFWVTATYRLGAWAHRLPDGPRRNAARALSTLLSAPVRVLKDVYLPPSADIGPGLVMLHPHAIFVAPGSVLGPGCHLFHDVTVGQGPMPGVPELGGNVTVYPGGRVLGGIRVGDDTEIGPNAVVTRHVPRGSIVVAPAARTIPAETASLVTSPGARAARAAHAPHGPSNGK